MTSQKSYFKPRVWVNTLRRGWPTSLLFFIIFFFTMPVVLLIITQNSGWSGSHTNESLMIVTGISRGFTYFMALFAGITGFKFMQNRTSAYYFHSLPISREAHYLHTWATGISSYLAALLSNTLICQIIMIANQKLNVDESGLLWQGAAQNLVFFALFFGVAMLAGVLCGTSAVQLVISLTAIYILPAFHFSLMAMVSEYMPFINTAKYLTYSVFNKLSFGVRIFTSMNEITVSAVENIVYLALILVMAVSGMLIFRSRRAERAGMPFIYPRFGSVVKYAVMVPVMILAGMIFGEALSNGNGLWRIFGYICGALLTFMLVNVISHKNAKAMFRNFRGFLIFAAVSALAITLFTFDAFGVNRYIPSENITKSVTLELSNMPTLTFTSKDGVSDASDLVRAIHKCVLKSSEDTTLYDQNENYIIFGEGDDRREYFNTSRMEYSLDVTFTTSLGVSVYKQYHITQEDKNALESELRALADSSEFKTAYLADYRFPSGANVRYTMTSFGNPGWTLTQNQIVQLEAHGKDNINWSYFQSRRYGGLYISDFRLNEGTERFFAYYPVMESDGGISELLNEMFADNIPTDAASSLDDISLIDSIIVVNTRTGAYKTYSDAFEIELISNSSAGEDVGIMTATENDYYMILCGYDYTYSEEYVIDAETDEQISATAYVGEMVWQFLRGAVPQFVLDDIG